MSDTYDYPARIERDEDVARGGRRYVPARLRVYRCDRWADRAPGSDRGASVQIGPMDMLRELIAVTIREGKDLPKHASTARRGVGLSSSHARAGSFEAEAQPSTSCSSCEAGVSQRGGFARRSWVLRESEVRRMSNEIPTTPRIGLATRLVELGRRLRHDWDDCGVKRDRLAKLRDSGDFEPKCDPVVATELKETGGAVLS